MPAAGFPASGDRLHAGDLRCAGRDAHDRARQGQRGRHDRGSQRRRRPPRRFQLRRDGHRRGACARREPARRPNARAVADARLPGAQLRSRDRPARTAGVRGRGARDASVRRARPGRRPAHARRAPGLLSQLVAIEHDVTHGGAQALLKAERGWFDRAACMRAELAPAALELAPGDSAAVGVAVRHVVEPVEVPMHLTAEPFHGASVTAADADAAPGAPARFTLVAPHARWSSRANPGFRIAGASRRGRVEGSIAAALKDKDVRFRITFTGTVDSSSSYRVDGSASSVTTDEHTTRGSFRLVWPDARFAVDARNAALVQGCGGAASCNDGTLAFDSHFRDDDPNRSYRRDGTCHAGGISPGFRGDTVFAVNTPALPGDPAPLVPGVRFRGFGPNLGFDVPCTEVVTQDGSSTTTEHGFAGALDNQSGFACRRQDLASAQYFAQADFHVSESVVLHDDAFEIAVGNGPGFSSSCNDGDDYTSSSWAFKWSGTVSFVRLPG